MPRSELESTALQLPAGPPRLNPAPVGPGPPHPASGHAVIKRSHRPDAGESPTIYIVGQDDRAAGYSAVLWRERFAAGQSLDRDRADLGRLVDLDHDEAETAYYEQASDPLALGLDRAQRRKAGQHARQLRRLRNRTRDRKV